MRCGSRGYTLTTLVIAGPLLWHLGDRIIGDGGDGAVWTWYLWQFRKAVESGANPAYSSDIFALLPRVHIFVNGFVDLVIAWPLQHLLSPLATYNLLVLASFVATGVTTYILVGEIGATPPARFAAGFLFSFSTYHFARAAGHLGLMTMQWLPLFCWRALVLFRQPTWRNSVWAGLALALVPLSDIYYAPYFALPFGIVLLLAHLWRDRGWFKNPRHLGMLALALVIAVSVAGPPLSSFLFLDSDVQQSIAAQRGSLKAASADLAALILPASENPLFGDLVKPIYQRMPSPWPVEKFVFLGHPNLLLALVALLRKRDSISWFWLAAASFALILAFGPELQVAGRAVVRLPFYDWVFDHAGLNGFRAQPHHRPEPVGRVRAGRSWPRCFAGSLEPTDGGGCDRIPPRLRRRRELRLAVDAAHDAGQAPRAHQTARRRSGSTSGSRPFGAAHRTLHGLSDHASKTHRGRISASPDQHDARLTSEFPGSTSGIRPRRV